VNRFLALSLCSLIVLSVGCSEARSVSTFEEAMVGQWSTPPAGIIPSRLDFISSDGTGYTIWNDGSYVQYEWKVWKSRAPRHYPNHPPDFETTVYARHLLPDIVRGDDEGWSLFAVFSFSGDCMTRVLHGDGGSTYEISNYVDSQEKPSREILRKQKMPQERRGPSIYL